MGKESQFFCACGRRREKLTSWLRLVGVLVSYSLPRLPSFTAPKARDAGNVLPLSSVPSKSQAKRPQVNQQEATSVAAAFLPCVPGRGPRGERCRDGIKHARI